MYTTTEKVKTDSECPSTPKPPTEANLKKMQDLPMAYSNEEAKTRTSGETQPVEGFTAGSSSIVHTWTVKDTCLDSQRKSVNFNDRETRYATIMRKAGKLIETDLGLP